jgi:hypothetical protein
MVTQTSHFDDFLIITNISFKYHLLKLEMVPARISTSGMKVNVFIPPNLSSLENKKNTWYLDIGSADKVFILYETRLRLSVNFTVYNHWKIQKLLSAIETCNFLLDYHWPIIVFKDHKSNTFNELNASYRVLCWLLLLEENGVIYEYLPGKKNILTVADTLSRLDIDDLKNQKNGPLRHLSRSKNSSISNIKFLMNTALIFKE